MSDSPITENAAPEETTFRDTSSMPPVARWRSALIKAGGAFFVLLCLLLYAVMISEFLDY